LSSLISQGNDKDNWENLVLQETTFTVCGLTADTLFLKVFMTNRYPNWIAEIAEADMQDMSMSRHIFANIFNSLSWRPRMKGSYVRTFVDSLRMGEEEGEEVRSRVHS
jgi:hypothetical protein